MTLSEFEINWMLSFCDFNSAESNGRLFAWTFQSHVSPSFSCVEIPFSHVGKVMTPFLFNLKCDISCYGTFNT